MKEVSVMDDYMAMASELLNLRAKMLRVPADRQLSRMVKGELFVLNFLATHEMITHPKELSENMAVSTARIASLLNHMEEKHLISRYPDKEDSRQVVVMLTETGRQEIQRVRAEVLSYISAMLEGLGPEDAEEYIRIEKKIWSNALHE